MEVCRNNLAHHKTIASRLYNYVVDSLKTYCFSFEFVHLKDRVSTTKYKLLQVYNNKSLIGIRIAIHEITFTHDYLKSKLLTLIVLQFVGFTCIICTLPFLSFLRPFSFLRSFLFNTLFPVHTPFLYTLYSPLHYTI